MSRQGSGRAQPKHLLVSACLITKDEEENLPSCLAAAQRIADEVVIYDTGSTDETVALARRLGAQVIEGYWDDDFARARNDALGSCRGEWILWVDADETFECDDPQGVRRLLRATKPEIDAWSVPIWNLTGAGVGAGFTHHAARLFRREHCAWVGRIHEQITRRGTTLGITQGVFEMGRIRHSGYLDSALVGRGKRDRNLRVAEREVEENDGVELGQSLISLGRSELLVGRLQEASTHCREALAHTDNDIARRLALRTCAEAHLGLGETEEAEAWIDQLAAVGGSQVQSTLLRARVALARGDHARALALFDTVRPGASDADGFVQSDAMLAPYRAEALGGMQRYAEAADTLINVLSDQGILDAHLGSVVEYLERAGRSLDDLAAALPAANAELFLAEIRQLRPDVADRALDSLWEKGRIRPLAILAAAAGTASQLPVERAMVWALRLRQAGIPEACPLTAQANDRCRGAQEQAQAAAIGWRMFADPVLQERFYAVYAAADDETRAQMLGEAMALCPELVGRQPDGQVIAATDPVSIVVPCLNNAVATLRLLRSIAAHTAPDTYQVILVDRGSTDAMTTLRGDPGNLALVVLDGGWGSDPATAIAVGVSAAAYDLVVLLDQDSEVLPGWLAPLVEVATAAGERARVVPRVLSRSGLQRTPGALGSTGLVLPVLVGSAAAVRTALRARASVIERSRGTDCGVGHDHTEVAQDPVEILVEAPGSYLVTGAVSCDLPTIDDFAQVLGGACR